MEVFLPLQSFHGDLIGFINKFRWSADADKRGSHRVSWDRIYGQNLKVSMNSGILKLLTKRCFLNRLSRYNDSLLAKVLNDGYLPRCDILLA